MTAYALIGEGENDRGGKYPPFGKWLILQCFLKVRCKIYAFK